MAFRRKSGPGTPGPAGHNLALSRRAPSFSDEAPSTRTGAKTARRKPILNSKKRAS